MRDGCCAESFRDVGDIGTEICPLFIVRINHHQLIEQTYGSKQDWYSSNYRQYEKEGNNHWSALWICSEDVVDLVQLSISQRLLILWQRDVGIGLDLEVKDVVTECLGRAEGGQEEGGAERLAREEKLDWEVFLCLGGCQLYVLVLRNDVPTKSTLPFPLSFTEKGKVVSNPVS